MRMKTFIVAALMTSQAALACDPTKEACHYTDGSFSGDHAVPRALALPAPDHHHSRDVFIGIAVGVLVVAGIVVTVRAEKQATVVSVTKAF